MLQDPAQDHKEQTKKTDDESCALRSEGEKSSNGQSSSQSEAIDIKGLEQVKLSASEQEMFNGLNQDLGFQVAVEQLIVSSGNLEPDQIQAKLLLILYQFCGKRSNNPEELKLLAQKKKHQIDEDVRILSTFIMQTRAQLNIQLVSKENGVVETTLDKSFEKADAKYFTKKVNTNLRNIIKRFAVYELYKFITPKRIAGETRKQNFVHNVLVGGLKRASHYAGGTKSEIKQYDPNFVKKLEKQHQKLAHGSLSGGKQSLLI